MSRSGAAVNSLLRSSRVSRSATFHVRCLATPSTSKPAFSQALADGPSLDDFIADSVQTALFWEHEHVRSPRLPSYLKTSIPKGASFSKIKKDLRGLNLHTVCEEARCPNIGDCWGGKPGETEEEGRNAATATIMLMGDTYLADGGAHHFAETIMKIKQKAPQILVEALTGDFGGSLPHVSIVAKSGLDVYAHNVETVEALTPFVRDRRATFRQSLSVLEHAKKEGVRITKTSIMLGVGEAEDQVMDTLRELRKVDVDVVTFGQYMRPTKRHMKVDRYVEPAEFDRWKQVAEDMGFLYVASGHWFAAVIRPASSTLKTYSEGRELRAEPEIWSRTRYLSPM
ncbi:Lipoyl synthase, mitochondrial [Grifola frondosa]|uniref:lipoyl synthase n=1 Tax=Grifola frondosa TaxID=5627 RepID=A0A1C7MRS4_GRIFR|nr:Lipoyl synthase, mitochondrial [Grifola frondosa]